MPGNAALPAHNCIIITRGLQEWACLLPKELPFPAQHPVPATCVIHLDERPDERQLASAYVDEETELHERMTHVAGTGCCACTAITTTIHGRIRALRNGLQFRWNERRRQAQSSGEIFWAECCMTIGAGL